TSQPIPHCRNLAVSLGPSTNRLGPLYYPCQCYLVLNPNLHLVVSLLLGLQIVLQLSLQLVLNFFLEFSLQLRLQLFLELHFKLSLDDFRETILCLDFRLCIERVSMVSDRGVTLRARWFGGRVLDIFVLHLQMMASKVGDDLLVMCCLTGILGCVVIR
ncbi:uncharacterized protein BCR38DRAFT_513411, partial [Pseudomassariella vexata]